MCGATKLSIPQQSSSSTAPSLLARYGCASVMVGFFALWCKLTFLPQSEVPVVNGEPIHTSMIPLALTTFYLLSLPLLQYFTKTFLEGKVDVKLLLHETMVVYNVGQVMANGWMVVVMIDAVLNRGHPFIGNMDIANTGATYAVWVHYCDKYLEFFDTYFMILRGKVQQVCTKLCHMICCDLSLPRLLVCDWPHLFLSLQYEQVSFLHVYHHVSIAWAWWYALKAIPAGDNYFGGLLNSWIHVMMYSYYALSLCKIPCPWKKYLTICQLIQFVTVVVYTVFSYRANMKDATALTNSAYCVQMFEMTSLFVLFMHFYNKTYSAKKKAAKSKQL